MFQRMLFRIVNNKLKLSPSNQHKNILGKFTEQEEELETYLKNMDAAFCGLTTIIDLRVLIYEYCTRYYIPHPFNRETKMTAKGFVSRVLKWNKNLPLRKPQSVVLNRIYGLNKAHVSLFFENLDGVLQ